MDTRGWDNSGSASHDTGVKVVQIVVPSVTYQNPCKNETLICPDCGTREALESIGVGAAEQEKILETIPHPKAPV